jgi:hypothetical protein
MQWFQERLCHRALGLIHIIRHKRWILHKTLCWSHKYVEFCNHTLLFISPRSTVLFPYLCLDLWSWHRIYWPVVSHQYIWPILSVICYNFVLRWSGCENSEPSYRVRAWDRIWMVRCTHTWWRRWTRPACRWWVCCTENKITCTVLPVSET